MPCEIPGARRIRPGIALCRLLGLPPVAVEEIRRPAVELADLARGATVVALLVEQPDRRAGEREPDALLLAQLICRTRGWRRCRPRSSRSTRTAPPRRSTRRCAPSSPARAGRRSRSACAARRSVRARASSSPRPKRALKWVGTMNAFVIRSSTSMPQDELGIELRAGSRRSRRRRSARRRTRSRRRETAGAIASARSCGAVAAELDCHREEGERPRAMRKQHALRLARSYPPCRGCRTCPTPRATLGAHRACLWRASRSYSLADDDHALDGLEIGRAGELLERGVHEEHAGRAVVGDVRELVRASSAR